jgi:hypothetical protein
MHFREAAGGCNELLGLVAVDRRDQRIASGEMAVESPGPDTGDPRDLIEAGPLTAGSATAQWRARSARRYPPPLDTLPTPYAALGKNELVGCQMALDEINAKGGILDHPVKLGNRRGLN